MDYEEWIAALKPGDKVGVFEWRGTSPVYQTVVTKRTPTGRVVCGDSTFKSDGYLFTSSGSPYRWRRLGPVPSNSNSTTDYVG